MDTISKKQFKKLYRTRIKYSEVYCCLCGKLITKPNELSLEHKLPKHRGGVDNFTNWDVSHRGCNNTRGALTFEEWHLWQELERKRNGRTK